MFTYYANVYILYTGMHDARISFFSILLYTLSFSLSRSLHFYSYLSSFSVTVENIALYIILFTISVDLRRFL